MNRIIIVFAFLSVLFSSCTTQPQGTLIHNVNGYTLLDNELHQFEAIAFENDEILATGSREELIEQFSGFEQIDGEGNTLLPGLIDAHVHVMGLGYQEMEVDVSGLESLDATLEKIVIMLRRIRSWSGSGAGAGTRYSGKKMSSQRRLTLTG